MLSMLSSCSISLPSINSHKISSAVTTSNQSTQIEPLKREDYAVLRTTSGKAASSRFYILFFPIGKHKSNDELYSSAYYDAVDNVANADALILPHSKINKFSIPLLLINYSRRAVTVTGVGISVKDKIIENLESDIPYELAMNYNLKNQANPKRIENHKITSQVEFDKYFEEITSNSNISQTKKIDFSKEYVIVISDKSTNKLHKYSVNSLIFKGSSINLSYTLEKSKVQTQEHIPFLLLVVDKKYQENILIK